MNRSPGQVTVKWLMVAVLVAAVDFSVARVLMRVIRIDPLNIAVTILTFDAFALVLFTAIDNILKRKRVRLPGELLVELAGVGLLFVLGGIPLAYVVFLFVYLR